MKGLLPTDPGHDKFGLAFDGGPLEGLWRAQTPGATAYAMSK